ncbi:MAG: DUF3857 domain-containing protein [Candidatus Polarisedimenticolia bacterium]
MRAGHRSVATLAVAIPALLPWMTLAVVAAPATPADSPTDWPLISAEERSLTRLTQDPEADAVVLNNERRGRIVKKGNQRVNELDVHHRMKILTDRGRRYSEVQIAAGKHSRVEGIEARTVLPDGRVVPVPRDQIFRKVVLQAGGIRDIAWVFNFPSAEAGAILEYRYRRFDDSLLFITPFTFAGPEHTLRARVSQSVPGDMAYTFQCALCPRGQPPVTERWRQGRMPGTTYIRELRDVPGYRDEHLMPPLRDAVPQLEMLLTGWRGWILPGVDAADRFFADWPSVGRYVATSYRESMKQGMGDLKRRVAGWIAGGSGGDETLRRVFVHVQRDVRYVPSNEVLGWSRSVEAILGNSAADNEEKAVLLVAALKAAGVTAHPALVAGRQGGTLLSAFYSLSQFTHVVAAVPRPDGTVLWLDPTETWAPFGFVSWRNGGASALLIQGLEGTIVTLPPRTSMGASRYRVILRPHPDGTAGAAIDATFTGDDAMELREELAGAAATARESFLQHWIDGRRPGSALESHTIDALEEPEQPLRLRLQARLPGMVTVADDTAVVRTCALTCLERNPAARSGRAHPFYVERGWDEEEVVVLIPPDGFRAGTPPGTAYADSTIGVLKFGCSGTADGSTTCTRSFIARPGRYPPSTQESVRRMYDAIMEADRQSIDLQPVEAAAPSGGRPVAAMTGQ